MKVKIIFKNDSQIFKSLVVISKKNISNKYLRFKKWYQKLNSILSSKGRKVCDEFHEKLKNKEITIKLKELIQILTYEEKNSSTFMESSSS